MLQPRRQLLVNGQREPIGKRALDILSVLGEARGGIVTKDELLEAVWPGVTVEENALQVHIVALRKALGPEANRLQTIRGVGYQLAIDGVGQRETAATEQEEREATISDAQPPAAVHEPLPPKEALSNAVKKPPTATLAAMWQRVVRRPWAIGLAALLMALAGSWAVFGDNLGLRERERIPIVVHALTATAADNNTEAALANGITDELIVRLRRVPDLQVGRRNSATARSGAFEGAYVVDGNISSSGDQLRVTARLTKANGEVLWTATFDRKIGQLFEMQEVIAASIANALSVSLDVGTDSIAYGGTNNPEAYANYMQFKINEFAFDQSVPLSFLTRAIALDPEYMKALSALSDSYSPRISYATSRAEADRLLAEMDASTNRMLEANPHLWMGHVSRAWYHIARKNFTAAKREIDLARRTTAQSDPELAAQLATLYYCLGYSKLASTQVQSAQIVDPLFRNDPRMIRELLYTGRYQQAIDQYDKLSRDGDAGRLNHNLETFWAYMLLGREREAIAFVDKQGNSQFLEQALAFKSETALPAMTMPQLRRWAIGKYGDGGHFQLANMAALASHYEYPELAINLMRLTLERPGAVAALTMWHPAFANARKTDGFERLAADLGLVKLWRETGEWPDSCRPVSATEITCV
jgi:DNA-binding winged helix-turn-helix (wHTH) protein/TolB-like protein